MSFVLPLKITRTTPMKIPYMLADKTYFMKKQEELELALLRVKKSKDDLLSQMAHELKNPLTSIILQTQMLKKIMEDGYSAENWERMQNTVDRSLVQLNRLNKLINTLLEDRKQ